jgi:hypothetical protein
MDNDDQVHYLIFVCTKVLRLLRILRLLYLLRLLSLHRLLSVIGFKLSFNEWSLLGLCESTIIYELRLQSQALYFIPITTILGRLALVSVGGTCTISYSMRKETSTFPGAACDSKLNSADGNQWWYVNTFALKWATSQ